MYPLSDEDQYAENSRVLLELRRRRDELLAKALGYDDAEGKALAMIDRILALEVRQDELLRRFASGASGLETGRPLPAPARRGMLICAKLRELGYDPMSLPDREKGRSGPKAEVRAEFMPDGHAQDGWTPRNFEDAWEWLRREEKIAGAE